jgi:hypothetical protein
MNECLRPLMTHLHNRLSFNVQEVLLEFAVTEDSSVSLPSQSAGLGLRHRFMCSINPAFTIAGYLHRFYSDRTRNCKESKNVPLRVRTSSAVASQRPVLGRPRSHHSPGRIQSCLNCVVDTQTWKSIARLETAVLHWFAHYRAPPDSVRTNRPPPHRVPPVKAVLYRSLSAMSRRSAQPPRRVASRHRR